MAKKFENNDGEFHFSSIHTLISLTEHTFFKSKGYHQTLSVTNSLLFTLSICINLKALSE